MTTRTTSVFRVLASGLVAGFLALSAVAAYAVVPDVMLNNEKLRFGGGGSNSSSFSYVDSVAANAMLEQPFYKASSGKWYKLTYSSYGLNMTLGSGTGGSNWSGATVPESGSFSTQGLTSINNLAVDDSGMTLRSPTQAVDYGYGTLVATGDVSLNGASVGISNTYALGQNASFVEITTAITNNEASPIDNVMIWVGTKDDYVGTSDVPTKTRGNLVGGSFQAISSSSDSSNAIQITSGAEGVLFYSTTPNAATTINDCCSFKNAYSQDPSTAPVTEQGDGAYAAVLPVGSLAAGATTSITWYYAAGALADLASVAAAVAAAAGSPPAASAADSSATVAWEQGDSGGGTITGYRVRYSSDGGNSWTTHSADFRGDAAPRELTISGLANGTEYEFQVASLTGDIDATPTVGEWSDSSSVLIAGAPTAPTITSIAPGAERLLVAFDTPSATGGFAITDYEYSTDNGSSWSSSGSTSSPITITGLTNGVSYSVKVRGKGSFSGVASAAVVGTPAASVAPFPPVISSIGAGNKTLTIQFTPPSDNGGAAISNYSYSTDGSTFRAFAPALTSSPASVTVLSSDGSTPLVNGTSYPISIKAINSTGASLVSNSVSGTPSAGSAATPEATPEATPAAPTAPYRLTVAPPARPIGDGLRIFRASEAPEEPVLKVGGRAVELEATVPSNGVLRLDSSSSGFGFSVEAPGGSVTKNAGGKTTISVAQERTAVLGGTGMQPNSRARAFLPLDGGNFVLVADIAVNDDGTFSAVGNFRNAPGKTPLPVGVTLLQLVSVDKNGNQIVLEVAVDIPQENPRPEVDLSDGGIVELEPGKFQGSSAGKPTVLQVKNTGRGFGFAGDGYEIEIASSDDGAVSTSENGELVLKLVRDEETVVSGKGFKPKTRADVYLFSEPTLVGSVTIDEDGNFYGEFNLDPELIPVGNHTLQVQGVGTDGYVKAANMGVVVEDSPSLRVVPLVPLAPWWTLWFILAGFLVVLVARWRRVLKTRGRHLTGTLIVLASATPGVILGWLSTVTGVVWWALGLGILASVLSWFAPQKSKARRDED